MEIQFTPEEIVAVVAPREVRGRMEGVIRGIGALEGAGPGELSFLGNRKYRAQVAGSRASMILLPTDYSGEPPAGQTYVIVENPSVALARICARIEQQLWPRPAPGVHATASVDAAARVAPSATVGPHCVVEAGVVLGERVHLQAQVFVGRNARIGDDCWIQPGVVISAECELGKRVRLQPGVIVGSDGFGYEFAEGRHEKVPQVGTVVIGDDVEIGANTTLDRARFSRTVIGEGTKIDNLVQVAHNVVIGRHCILCAQVGISGSTTLGDYAILGGQAGVAGHITIGQGGKVGAQAGVRISVEPGGYVNGSPALPFMLERRITVLRQRLPDLFRRVDALESQLEKSSAR